LPEWVYFPTKLGFENYQSAEWYYDEIKRQAEEKGKSLDDLVNEMSGSLLDDHSNWEECDDELLKEKVKGINQKAIRAQKEMGWGNVSAGLAESIIAANRPVVNWKRELRYFINRLVQRGRQSTRSRPNRRYGYKQPGTKRSYTSRVLVAIDTSGSISEQDLSDFLTETNGMIDHIQCDIVCFDTVVYGKPKRFTKKVSELEVKGRGGTSFGPVFDVAEDNKYDGIIMLTDGFAEFPEKPLSLRILWALTESGRDVEPPYGKKVVIDKEHKA